VTSPAARLSRTHRSTEPLALACILALAAVLRFGALDWGLRHEPHVDERYFVENAGWMLEHRDLDHRFDEYPGLFFYLTLPVLAWFGPPRLGPDGYLAARALVAAFGVASVGLTCLLGTRLRGPFVGLAAALLSAVSPVAVQTAHMVRPDVVLEAFVLLAFLGFARVGRRASGDWTAGALVGAATAVKFTGVLLAPAYVVVRLLRPGRRVAGLALAGAASIAVFAVCSPYSVLEIGRALAGATTQVAYHYGERPRGAQSVAGMAWTYGLVLRKALGALALALALAGAVLGWRDWRRLLPLWVFPLTVVAVFSTAEVHHDRFLLPALGVSAILCAEGAGRLGRLRAAAAVAMAVMPLGRRCGIRARRARARHPRPRAGRGPRARCRTGAPS
jgi:4-amino-4-deoxy-L-arabinose transferase-like glycosyltransferase